MTLPEDKNGDFVRKLKEEITNGERLAKLENQNITDIDEYRSFMEELDNFIYETVVDYYGLENESEYFLTTLKSSNIDMYTFSQEDKERLRYYMMKKKLYKKKLMIYFLEKQVINFEKDINQSMKAFIESNIGEFFDDIYFNFIENLPEQDSLGGKENTYYGGVREGNIVGYDQLASVKIDKEKLKEIKFENIRNYLLTIVELIENGNFNYDDWIKAEEYECKNWSSDEKMVIVSPMEKLIHKSLVDPELMIYLRKETDFSPEGFAELAETYFGKGYDMEKTNLDIVEGVWNGGVKTFSQFLGKSFPNDYDLRNQYGPNILLVRNSLAESLNDNLGTIKKVLGYDGNEIENRKDEVVEEFEMFVACHEYGHSLFRTENKLSLEECKADLNYFVYLHDKYLNKGQELTKEEAYKIVYALLLEIRQIRRLYKESFSQYVLGTKVMFFHLFDSEVFSYDSENQQLVINDENLVESLKGAIEELKNVMYQFKDIYENLDEAREQQINDYYSEKMDSWMKEIYEVVS